MAEKEKYTDQPRSAERSAEKSIEEFLGPLPKKEYELAPKEYEELPKKEYEKKKPEVNYTIKKAKPGYRVPKQQYT